MIDVDISFAVAEGTGARDLGLLRFSSAMRNKDRKESYSKQSQDTKTSGRDGTLGKPETAYQR